MTATSLSPRIAGLLTVTCLVGLVPAPAHAQSSNVNLESNFDPSVVDYADIWGYDSGGTEIAILMDNDGTYFVDVTNPAAPNQVGFIDGVNSIWRDAKTFDQYAYIVNEAGGGLQIVSLVDPLNPSLVGTVTSEFQTAHNVWIDQDLGLLFAVGSDFSNGVGQIETNIYDLEGDIIGTASPTNPEFVFNFNTFYVHDMYSQDGIAYFAAVNNGLLVTADLTQLPTSVPVLDTIASDNGVTHNVWTTTDGNYAFTTDETGGGHITIFDVSNPSNVARVGQYTNPDDPGSIIHNVAVSGNVLYASWYNAGLEVVDITVPTSPQRLGFYDTTPASGAGFTGAWGVYPFAPSGSIYVSDIQTGLYVFSLGNDVGFADGTVTDQVSGDPIENVTVEVDGGSSATSTNDTGLYHFVLAPDSYMLTFDNFFYESDQKNVTITGGASTVTNVQLVPKAAGSLDGTVRDDTTTPLAGAEVVVDASPLSATTPGSGTYGFDPVPVGNYSVVADAFGFAPQALGAAIAEGNATTLDFALVPAEVADDVETDAGWTVGDAGDDASTGIWERVDPNGTSGQPEDDHTPAPGVTCWITGQHPIGQGAGANDVDDGVTTLFSPIYDLSGLGDATVEFYRWYTTNESGTPSDIFRVDVSINGLVWVNVQTLQESSGAWEQVSFTLSSLGLSPTSQVQLRFIAGDLGQPSLVEAGVDDIEIYGTTLVAIDPSVPLGLTRLLPVSPNPFRTDALVRFELADRSNVLLNVYDVQGRLVRRLVNGTIDAGAQTVRWDGRTAANTTAAPGVYYVRLEAPAVTSTQKVVRTR